MMTVSVLIALKKSIIKIQGKGKSGAVIQGMLIGCMVAENK